MARGISGSGKCSHRIAAERCHASRVRTTSGTCSLVWSRTMTSAGGGTRARTWRMVSTRTWSRPYVGIATVMETDDVIHPRYYLNKQDKSLQRIAQARIQLRAAVRLIDLMTAATSNPEVLLRPAAAGSFLLGQALGSRIVSDQGRESSHPEASKIRYQALGYGNHVATACQK